MKEFFDKYSLKETIEFNDSIFELKERIRFKRDRKFILEWDTNNEFKVLSKISIGTIILNSNPDYFDGIKGYGKLIELENGKTEIKLNTKFRIEIYIIIILAIIFPFTHLLVDENIPFWTLFIFPIMVLFLWYTYRYQEKILFENVRNYIKKELNYIK